MVSVVDAVLVIYGIAKLEQKLLYQYYSSTLFLGVFIEIIVPVKTISPAWLRDTS